MPCVAPSNVTTKEKARCFPGRPGGNCLHALVVRGAEIQVVRFVRTRVRRYEVGEREQEMPACRHGSHRLEEDKSSLTRPAPTDSSGSSKRQSSSVYRSQACRRPRFPCRARVTRSQRRPDGCAQNCARTRSDHHHPASNAIQVRKEKQAETSRVPACFQIAYGLNKPPPSAARPPHRGTGGTSRITP